MVVLVVLVFILPVQVEVTKRYAFLTMCVGVVFQHLSFFRCAPRCWPWFTLPRSGQTQRVQSIAAAWWGETVGPARAWLAAGWGGGRGRGWTAMSFGLAACCDVDELS